MNVALALLAAALLVAQYILCQRRVDSIERQWHSDRESFTRAFLSRSAAEYVATEPDAYLASVSATPEPRRLYDATGMIEVDLLDEEDRVS